MSELKVEPEPLPQQTSRAIFMLHGIRTAASWQRCFADIATEAGWMPRLDRWSYGYFSVLRFLLPRQRKAKVEWFNKAYEAEISDRRVDVDHVRPPSIVVHSFGSYILGNALLKYDGIRLNKVILCGAILPRDFPWDKLLETGQVQAVRNEYGTQDRWSKLVRWFVRGSGDSGVKGFLARHSCLEQQIYPHFAHSDYFDKNHMRETWLPFLNKPQAQHGNLGEEAVTWKTAFVPPVGLYVLYLALCSVLLLASALVLPGVATPFKAKVYLRMSTPPDVEALVAPYRQELMEAQGSDGGIGIAKGGGSAEQIWTTAQALKGVTHYSTFASQHRNEIRHAFDFIETNRHKTGRELGWGLFPPDPHTLTEINAWVQLAYLQALNSGVIWSDLEAPGVVERIHNGLDDLVSRQAPAGGWPPVIGKNDNYTRTYSTVMSVWALAEAQHLPATQAMASLYNRNLYMGVQWLLAHRDSRLGWIPNPNREPQDQSVPGLAAQTFFVLSRVATLPQYSWLKSDPILADSRASLLANTQLLSRPLTENELLAPGDQYVGKVSFGAAPEEFRLEGSGFLWYPWLLAAYNQMVLSEAPYQDRIVAQGQGRRLLQKINQGRSDIDNGEMFIPAEALIGIAEGSTPR